jgi:hypothetical protein
MAKKKRVVLVDEGGGVPAKVTVESKKIEKVKWLPEIEDELITITFDINNIPFSDSSWKTGTDTNTSLTGKLKDLGTGMHTFEYRAEGWGKRKRPDANPELIVDGGRRRKRRSR